MKNGSVTTSLVRGRKGFDPISVILLCEKGEKRRKGRRGGSSRKAAAKEEGDPRNLMKNSRKLKKGDQRISAKSWDQGDGIEKISWHKNENNPGKVVGEEWNGQSHHLAVKKRKTS